jgi:hypothetical protein
MVFVFGLRVWLFACNRVKRESMAFMYCAHTSSSIDYKGFEPATAWLSFAAATQQRIFM